MEFIKLFILVIALGAVGIFFYLKHTDEKQQKEASRLRKQLGSAGNPSDQHSAEQSSHENIRKSAVETMFDEGLTYGEAVAKATGGANLVDGKQTWEHAGDSKHDINVMKKCCDAEIETWRKTGDCPAPYYFWRVAVLSRKQKDYVQEVNYCERYLDMLREGYSRDDMSFETALETRVLSARMCDIYERLPKAKALLAKHQA
jgi:hypothetical protein